MDRGSGIQIYSSAGAAAATASRRKSDTSNFSDSDDDYLDKFDTTRIDELDDDDDDFQPFVSAMSTQLGTTASGAAATAVSASAHMTARYDLKNRSDIDQSHSTNDYSSIYATSAPQTIVASLGTGLDSSGVSPRSKKLNLHPLPDYLAEQLLVTRTTSTVIVRYPISWSEDTHLWRRFLRLAVGCNRLLLRLVLPLSCFIPVLPLGWTIAVLLIFSSFVFSMLPSLYVILSLLLRRKQLLKVSRGSAASTMDQPIDQDIETSTHGQKSISSTKFVPSRLFSSLTLGVAVPLVFELVCWLLFSCALFGMIGADLFSTGWSWLLSLVRLDLILGVRILPLMFGLLYLGLAHWVPCFDSLRMLELNDRLCCHNNIALICHNISLEQYERFSTMSQAHGNVLTARGGASAEQWEVGSRLGRRPALMFDQIKDVALAVSLETMQNRPVNAPWLLIRQIVKIPGSGTSAEHTVLLPIRLPEVRKRSFAKFLFSVFLGPLFEVFSIILQPNGGGNRQQRYRSQQGMSVEETRLLLQEAVASNRPDLQENVRMVTDSLSSIHEWGLLL